MIPSPESTVPAPAMDETFERAAKKKRYPVQREWCLQRGVTRFVKRAVPQPHRFAGFDRGAATSENAHAWEEERAISAGEPDTELLFPGMPAVKIELKWGDNEPTERQLLEIRRTQDAGHLAGWANSVYAFGSLLVRLGVPLLPNWPQVAAHEDELVAADVRKQETKAAAKRNGTYKPKRGSKPRAAKPTRSQVRRTESLRGRLPF